MDEKELPYEYICTTGDPGDLAVLYGKLAKVMAQLNRIPKTGRNTHFNYDFATDADVSDSVRKALAEQGIAFFANLDSIQRNEEPTQRGGVQIRTIIDMSFTFADGDTGATRTCKWQGEALDQQDKGLNKAYTAAEKYFLLKTFLISTGDEPDTDAEVHESPPEIQQAKDEFIKSKAEFPEGWFPTKVQFFEKVKADLGFEPKEAAPILKQCNIQEFDLKKVPEMWLCLDAEYRRLSEPQQEETNGTP